MNLELYAIIDSSILRGTSPLQAAKEIVAGGATACQLRAKNMKNRDLYNLASSLKKVVKEKKALFLINDRIDIALAVDADGVHLGSGDLPIKVARKLLGRNKIIGLTVRNLSQALKAQREGADYVSLGPIFSTRTKNNLPPPRGLKVITQIKKNIKIPLIAVGGINSNNLARVLRAGADGVAVASAVNRVVNIRKAIEDLLFIIKEVKR